MVTCAVINCSNSSGSRSEGGEGEKVKFVSFPKDEKLFRTWLNRCARKDLKDVEPSSNRGANLRICAVHFKDSDLTDSCQCKLKMGISTRLELVEGALPSLNLQCTYDGTFRDPEPPAKRKKKSQ